jgi:hypothetical protein
VRKLLSIAVAWAALSFAVGAAAQQDAAALAEPVEGTPAEGELIDEPVETESAEAQPVEASSVEEDKPIEEVLVTGEQPGPKLWKVSKGEHTMWVLGTHGPLPKKMKWKSSDVEALIGESQEVLTPGGYDARPDIGWLKALTLLPSLFRAAKSPDGAKLQDLLPPDVYERWLVLKKKYLGRDEGVEKWRPAFAWEKLQGEAIEKTGFERRNAIWPVVSRAAKKHRVKIIDTTVHEKIKIEKPKAALQEFAKLEAPDVECFTKSIDRLEENLQAMISLANAWAIGDIGALLTLRAPDESANCQTVIFNAVLNSQLGKDFDVLGMIERGQRSAQEKWLAAAEAALSNNRTTFAVLPIAELARPEGRLALLQARGYVVQAPPEIAGSAPAVN